MAIDLSKFPITINKKLMADNKLAINFSMPTLENFPIGTFLDVDNERYYLNRPAVIEKGGKDIWKYTLSLEADAYLLLRKRFLFLGSRKFSILGDLEFFIDLILTNINETYPTWTKGDIDTTDNKTLSFEAIDCRGALNQIAQEFDVEFDFFNREITAKKEVGQVTGYTFEYGQGKGLYKLNRKNVDSKETVTRVYGFGSSKNLPSDYGKTELSFSEGYVEDFSEFSDIIEADYTNDQIFPSFTGAISAVVNDLQITVPSMDFNLLDQLNAGQEAKVVFRSGDMIGREFVIKDNSYNNTTKTFTLIANTDESGTIFPNAFLDIKVGDTLTFIDINMPQSYVDSAEADLKADTELFLSQNKSVRVVYDLVFDQRFLTKFGILPKPGDIVRIVDTDFGIDRNIRLASTVRVQANTLMTSFKATISDFIPISNQNRLVAKTIENAQRTEIVNISNVELARQNTLKNRLLQDRLFDTDDFFDTGNIRPLSINTSFLSVGAKSQNFQLDGVSIQANYNADENRFLASAGTLRHLEVSGTAGQDWTMSALDVSGLVTGNFYYLYAKCSKTVANGVWLLSTAKELADQANDYYFLVGILYEVIDGFRQTSFTYGSTFINGRTITTGRIISIDGLNYFDLDSGQFRIGNATSSLDWNVTGTNQLTLKGILVQNPGGSTSGLAVFRGPYSGVTIYYKDDLVTNDGNTWRYINSAPTSGNTPVEGTYWTIDSAKGDQGDKGDKGDAFVIDEQGLDAGKPDPTTKAVGYTYFATDTSLLYFVQAGAPQTWSAGTPFGQGDGIEIEYSSDQVNWHTSFLAGDLYSRWRVENTVTWQGPFRIVGETGDDGNNGIWFDFKYAAGSTPPSVDNTLNPIGWFDNPPDATGTKLWQIKSTKITNIELLIDFDLQQFVDFDTQEFEGAIQSFVTVADWSEPIQINGNDGSSGTNGTDGADGNYIEYQYAKNGSTSVPPSIVVGDLNPVGWSTIPPVVVALEYLWITKSTKNAAGTVLVVNWSTPTRISGINGSNGTDGTDGSDGTNGTDGVDGATGPSPVYQGVYDNGKSYFGTATRVDIVQYVGVYYVVRSDAGTFSGILPTDTAKWNPFGATFDSVATDLLFASLAYIENLGVQNLKTASSGQRVEITAAGNDIKFYDASNNLNVEISDAIGGSPLGGVRVQGGVIVSDNNNEEVSAIFEGDGGALGSTQVVRVKLGVGVPIPVNDYAVYAADTIDSGGTRAIFSDGRLEVKGETILGGVTNINDNAILDGLLNLKASFASPYTSVPNNSLFRSQTPPYLRYKDVTGTIQNLY